MKHSLLLIVGCFLLLSCQTEIQQKHIMRLPKGNLGSQVNSPGDEINPIIPPLTDYLYITTNREGQQDLWVSKKFGNTFDSAQNNRTPISTLLSFGLTNDGSIAFLTDSSGIFSSGHPLDENFANRSGRPVGGIVGGTDLFSFSISREHGYEIQNLKQLNSFYWDSHPAVTQWNDTLLIVFSSDRPVAEKGNTTGFSAPFRNQKSVIAGDTINGNADLYFAFFANGEWSIPRNLNSVFGEAINTTANEYTPFLFCVPRSPVLYFSSDRGNEQKLDLYRAELQINFGQQMIVVENVETISDNDINIPDAHEMFPFIPYPHLDQTAYEIYFASDRDDTLRHWDTARYELKNKGDTIIKNVGGFDIYRFPIQEECGSPKVIYSVVLLNAANPNEPIEEPIIAIRRGGKTEQYRASRVQLELNCGEIISTYGGSTYDTIRCVPEERTLSHYAIRKILPRDTVIKSRRTKITRRYLIHGIYSVISDTSTYTIPLTDFANFQPPKNETILSLELQGDSLRLRLVRTEQVLDSAKSEFKTITEWVTHRDTIIRWDTLYRPAYEEHAPSVRTERNDFPTCNPDLPYQRDIVVQDTIWLYPQYLTFPPCVREFTKDEKFIRNVPYFQTTFWEVNTPKNLERHLAIFRTKPFQDAGFIELHRKNQYWGPENPIRSGQSKGKYERLWLQRIAQYRCYAKIVERNFQIMQKSINDTILPSYMKLLEKLYGDPFLSNPDEKLIIQITAYSDPRPIRRGWYIGPSIRYLAAYYDTLNNRLRFPRDTIVIIPSGASLVGENNDTLSKLRAYYGYTEFLDRLRQSTTFQLLEASGKVLLPTDVSNPDEFFQKVEKSAIIILVEGRYADTSQIAQVYGYRNIDLLSECDPKAVRSEDFFEYDDVRRVDITVHRVRFQNQRVFQSSCGCREDK